MNELNRTATTVKADGRYTKPAVLMHWMSALLVFGLLCLGWYLESLPKGPERGWFIGLHKSLGICLLALTLMRVAWRVSHTPPPLSGTLPVWQRTAASSVHRLLYLFLLIQPISGYVSASFSGHPMLVFGYPIYNWGWKDAVLNDLFSNVHEFSSWGLTFLVGLHLGGVFWHAFRPADYSIRRMMPW